MKRLVLAVVLMARGFSQNNDCDDLDKCREALKAKPHSSLIRFRIGEFYFVQRNYQNASNEFRYALAGDLEPKWTEVWAHVNLGKIFDVGRQRDRALNEYRLALKTKDNTRGALDEAAKYIETPYKPD